MKKIIYLLHISFWGLSLIGCQMTAQSAVPAIVYEPEQAEIKEEPSRITIAKEDYFHEVITNEDSH